MTTQCCSMMVWPWNMVDELFSDKADEIMKELMDTYGENAVSELEDNLENALHLAGYPEQHYDIWYQHYRGMTSIVELTEDYEVPGYIITAILQNINKHLRKPACMVMLFHGEKAYHLKQKEIAERVDQVYNRAKERGDIWRICFDNQRVRFALSRARYTTLSEVFNAGESKIRRLPNIGDRSMRYIKDKLVENGFDAVDFGRR